MRRIKAVVLAVLFTFVLLAAPAEAAEVDMHSFSISPSGIAEFWGYVQEEGEKVAILMCSGDGSVITADTIIYIDQVTAGPNGGFHLKWMVEDKWAGMDYTVACGGTKTAAARMAGSLPQFPELKARIDNNSLRCGQDAYSLSGAAYRPEEVARSIAEGGNIVWFKIGGMWFDLQKPEATSSAYLTAENEVPDEEYTAWEIRKYYAQGKILEGA